MGIKGQRARKAGIACGTVVGSVLLALSTATSGGAASSALVIGGISTPSLHDLVMSRLLGGALQDRERVSVNWPAEAGPYTGRGDLTLGQSIDIGIANLNAEIDAALDRLERDEDGRVMNGENVTVVGLSGGSLVVTEVLRQMAADEDAPDASEINFVVVADSSRQELIRDARYNSRYDYTYQPAPETEYDTLVVTGEYDGLADFPDRPWNLLAVANAMVGSIFVHVPVMFRDLADVPPEYVTTEVNSQGGSVTNYLVPAERLPLVQLLPFLESSEASLKAMVDRGYSRNDAPRMLGSSLTQGLTATSATSALSAPTVTDDSETSATSLRRASARAAALADEVPRSGLSATSEKAATTTGAQVEAEPKMATSQRAETQRAERAVTADDAKAVSKASEAKAGLKSEAKAGLKSEAKSETGAVKSSTKSNAGAGDKAKSAKDSKVKSESTSASKSDSKSSDSKKNTSKKRESARAGSR